MTAPATAPSRVRLALEFSDRPGLTVPGARVFASPEAAVAYLRELAASGPWSPPVEVPRTPGTWELALVGGSGWVRATVVPAPGEGS